MDWTSQGTKTITKPNNLWHKYNWKFPKIDHIEGNLSKLKVRASFCMAEIIFQNFVNFVTFLCHHNLWEKRESFGTIIEQSRVTLDESQSEPSPNLAGIAALCCLGRFHYCCTDLGGNSVSPVKIQFRSG